MHEQVTLWFTDWAHAEETGRTRLGPTLAQAHRAGLVQGWWFVRKRERWHLRYRPSPGCEATARATMEQHLHSWAQGGALLHWTRGVYEPETHAFGGPKAMERAHALFHTDSHHLLAHLGEHGTQHRTLLAVLRVCALLRGAGQDWYEQGDVFARVTAHRPTERTPTDTEAGQLDHLLTARLPHPLMDTAWTDAFHQAGQDTAGLALAGTLTRGPRAVLAHHVLFAWNRAGVSAAEQGLIARAAATAIFHHTPVARLPEPTTHEHITTTVSRVNTISNDTAAARLRDALADKINSRGTFRTPAVEAAFRTVPRHLFLPEVDLETAYQPQVVVTKRDVDGTALSSASAPNLVANMLEQLDAQPGDRVLEIGAATGINAALLREIVGPTGAVTTIEIDDDLADGARRHLETAGYDDVEVICGDGALGHTPTAPYDRIIVTAGAWTIPTSWWEQLAPHGRLVVPVRLHGSGLTRSLPFDRTAPDTMIATSALVCGFVPMRGAADAPGRSVGISEGASLNVAAEDHVDEAALGKALDHPSSTVWTDVTFTTRKQVVAHLDLWLATHDAHFGRLSVTPRARENGIDPTPRWAGACLHDGAGSLAYLVLRELHDTTAKTEEIGVLAHGPDAGAMAEHLTSLVRQWAQTMPPQPTVTAHPATSSPEELPAGVRVVKPDTSFTITW